VLIKTKKGEGRASMRKRGEVPKLRGMGKKKRKPTERRD